MTREAIANGNTIEEAITEACEQLGIDRDEVSIEILEYPKTKTLGLFGGSPAKVRVYFDDGKEEPKPKRKPADKPAAPETKPKPQDGKAEASKPRKTDAPADKPADAPAKMRPQAEKAAANEPGKTPASGLPESAADYLRGILAGMGLDNVRVVVREEGDNTASLDLEGDNLGFLIGRRGETMAALQYLVSLAANNKGQDYYRISVNVGSYRQYRDSMLQQLAQRTTSRALRIGRNLALEPMNPYERRVIHTAVQSIDGASSWSMGEGNHRHVVVGPEGVAENQEGLPPRREDNGGRFGGGNRGGYNNRSSYGARDNRGYAPRDNSRGGYRNDRGGPRDNRSYGSRDNRGGYNNSRGQQSGGYSRHDDIKTLSNNSYDYSTPAKPAAPSAPKKDVAAPLYGRIQVPKKDNQDNEE